MLGNDSREILNTFKGNSEYLLALSALSLRIEKIKGFVDFRNTNTTTKDGVPRTTTITYTKQQRAMAYSHHIQAKPARFLDASLHFYMRVCPFVRRSVRHSVRPSVCPLDGQSVRILFFFSNAENRNFYLLKVIGAVQLRHFLSNVRNMLNVLNMPLVLNVLDTRLIGLLGLFTP